MTLKTLSSLNGNLQFLIVSMENFHSFKNPFKFARIFRLSLCQNVKIFRSVHLNILTGEPASPSKLLKTSRNILAKLQLFEIFHEFRERYYASIQVSPIRHCNALMSLKSIKQTRSKFHFILFHSSIVGHTMPKRF